MEPQPKVWWTMLHAFCSKFYNRSSNGRIWKTC